MSDPLAIFAASFFAQFAEDVEYAAHGEAEFRELKAQVDREPARAVEEFSAQTLAYVFVVSVRNDAELGIDAAGIRQGLDRLRVAPRPGAALETRFITSVLSVDSGIVTRGVR